MRQRGILLTSGGDPEHSIKVGNPFTGDGRAIYFDGTDDYLTVDDGANIDLGTGDFTIEFWMNSDDRHPKRDLCYGPMGRHPQWRRLPLLGNGESF
jgi:hypothetical protein